MALPPGQWALSLPGPFLPPLLKCGPLLTPAAGVTCQGLMPSSSARRLEAKAQGVHNCTLQRGGGPPKAGQVTVLGDPHPLAGEHFKCEP